MLMLINYWQIFIFPFNRRCKILKEQRMNAIGNEVKMIRILSRRLEVYPKSLNEKKPLNISLILYRKNHKGGAF